MREFYTVQHNLTMEVFWFLLYKTCLSEWDSSWAKIVCFHLDLEVSNPHEGWNPCCLTLLWSHGLQSTRLLCPWNFPGKNTGVGCHFLLQGIFPTQGSNSYLLQCRHILYHWATREVEPWKSFDFYYTKHVSLNKRKNSWAKSHCLLLSGLRDK